MGIFLRQSYNVKPPRWGSSADVQHAIKINAEKIYQVDPDSIVLAMPLFWGLPPLDYSGKNNHGTNHGATYKDGSLDFDGTDDYIDIANESNFDFLGDLTGQFTLELREKQNTVRGELVGKMYQDGTNGRGVGLRCTTAGKLGFIFAVYGSYDYYETDNAVTGGNNDHHSVFIFNNDSGAFYVDGAVKPNTKSSGGSGGATHNISETVRIGARHGLVDGDKKFLDGILDEVRISNVAHSSDQIALFHDLPYGLYQPVSRPVYFFQATEEVAPTANLYGPLWGPFRGVI